MTPAGLVVERRGYRAIERVAALFSRNTGEWTVEELATQADCSISSVRYAITELVRSGAVKRLSRRVWLSTADWTDLLVRRAREGGPIEPPLAVFEQQIIQAGHRDDRFRSSLCSDLDRAERCWRDLMGTARFVDAAIASAGVPRRMAPEPLRTIGGVSRPWA